MVITYTTRHYESALRARELGVVIQLQSTHLSQPFPIDNGVKLGRGLAPSRLAHSSEKPHNVLTLLIQDCVCLRTKRATNINVMSRSKAKTKRQLTGCAKYSDLIALFPVHFCSEEQSHLILISFRYACVVCCLNININRLLRYATEETKNNPQNCEKKNLIVKL